MPGLLFELRRSLGQFIALVYERGWLVWSVPAMALGIAATAVMPLFYIALWRSHDDIKSSARLRPMAIVAAVCLGVGTIWSLRAGIEAISADYSPDTAFFDALWRSAGCVGAIQWLLISISVFAPLLTLAALYRNSGDNAQTLSRVSRMLNLSARLGAIIFVLWILVGLFRLAISHFLYSQIRDPAVDLERFAPFSTFFLPMFRDLADGVGLYSAPWIVFKSLPTDLDESGLKAISESPV
jgi:hypothetical protein